jgi:uncharacterized membrane protein
VTDSFNTSTNKGQLFVFDTSVPGNAVVTSLTVPANVGGSGFIASGGDLYTVDGSNLIVYKIAPSQQTPVTAKVTVPTGGSVSIVPGSFSLAPTVITPGNGVETLEWDIGLAPGGAGQTITFQSSVSGLQPGQSQTVAQGGTVSFVSQGTPGLIPLPAQLVAGQQIIGLSPPTQTVAPAAPASYSVTVQNPTSSPVTYALSVQGVSPTWVTFPSSVVVPANGSISVPLGITSAAFAAVGDYGFTVSASGNNEAQASVGGDLVLQGTPAPLDPESHGIVPTLTPSQATAGQGTSASYVVQLTNTGSADESFSLAALGLPSGVTASFGQSTVDIPPGASNFRDVSLKLTSQKGTAPSAYNFTIKATSTELSSVTGSAVGTLTVVKNGVGVSLNPPAGAPGSAFLVTVTNTGTVSDTYDLALAGPSSLVAKLASSVVTLAPGASQTVQVTTGSVNFAEAGALNLTAMATSRGNTAVKGAASTQLAIPPSRGFSAQLDSVKKTLPSPGATTFSLNVQNTGNTEDAFTASITGTSGPIRAALTAANGSPTQSIPVFRLPGLSAASLGLKTTLTAPGTGTVTIAVRSLTNGALVATITATVTTTVIPTGDGPKITRVLRYGIHWQPTILVLAFDSALDPTRAQNVNNYIVVDPSGKRVPVSAAIYSPAAHTVTLYPSRQLNFHYNYFLVVNGAQPFGLTNAQGVLLDGDNDGKPGGNYITVINQSNLVWGVATPTVTPVRTTVAVKATPSVVPVRVAPLVRIPQASKPKATTALALH